MKIYGIGSRKVCNDLVITINYVYFILVSFVSSKVTKNMMIILNKIIIDQRLETLSYRRINIQNFKI